MSPVVASITPVPTTLAQRQLVDAIQSGERSVNQLRAQASALVQHAAQFKRDEPIFAALWAGHFAPPITTHEDYRIRPLDWLGAIALLCVLYLLAVGILADALMLFAR